MFIKTGVSSIKKETESAFGDCILTKRYKDSDKVIAVLSDGLGSGIKANILSTMTSTMLLGFAENGADLTKACEIVMNSLPVCKVRKISYSTFSIVVADGEGNVSIIEEGNPDFILIRNNYTVDIKPEIMVSKTHKDRHLKIYNFRLNINDALIFVSDGVTQAGLGSKNLKEGLKREGLIHIVLDYIKSNKDYTPDGLAKRITSAAKAVSIDNKANDDISALVLKCTIPESAIVFTGPPFNSEEDRQWAKNFEEFEGKKAVAGGTTAKILSRELKKELVLSRETAGSLPAVSFMDGADIITEGILTLTRVEEYLSNSNPYEKKDAAADLIKFLLSADCISFVVGAKVNTAHYDPNLPIEIELRKDVVKRIANILKEKYLKKVVVQYV